MDDGVADLVDAALWYEDQQPGLSERLFAHIGAALDAISERSWPADTVVHIATAMDIRLATAIPVIETPGGTPGFVSTGASRAGLFSGPLELSWELNFHSRDIGTRPGIEATSSPI